MGSRRPYTGAIPTFFEMATRYLDEDTGHLAATTRQNRHFHLHPDGPVLPHLGQKRPDDIAPSTPREWWNLEILDPEKSGSSALLGISLLGFIRSAPAT